MTFDENTYYGYILKGDLHGVINYIRKFPEKAGLYRRFLAIFEDEQYISYDVDGDLNKILIIYQQYYREVFYLGVGKSRAAENLKIRLAAFLGLADEAADQEKIERRLTEVVQQKGLHILLGKTSGYYGPYIWRTTETVSYGVELPAGIQTYSVKLLDGFITRSWIDYLSFGQMSPGGWTDGDGVIHCVKSSYDFDSESFRVSLLKHEAQHARDLAMDPTMSSVSLEYRAKLVELIYSIERNLLKEFAQEADPSDQSNGHAAAADRIVKGFCRLLGMDAAALDALPMEQIQRTARILFDESGVS